MPNKHMRQIIKVEGGEGVVHLIQGARRGEEYEAGRRRRRRPNDGAAEEADETQLLRAANVAAQSQAFGEMERARLMELELQRAKADVARLQVEAKVKEEASKVKEEALQAVIRCKDDIIMLKKQLLQAKEAEIRWLHAEVARTPQVQAAAANAPAPAPALGRVASSGPGFLSNFGRYGASNVLFKYPKFMAWDQQGNVLVADADNHRLQFVRLSDGACLRTIGCKGSGAGEFQFPFGVAFDSAGLVRFRV
jgi:hypothetical protein